MQMWAWHGCTSRWLLLTDLPRVQQTTTTTTSSAASTRSPTLNTSCDNASVHKARFSSPVVSSRDRPTVRFPLLCFCFALQPVDMKKMFGGLGAAKKKPAPAKPVAMDAAVAEVLAPIQSTRPGHRHRGTHVAELLPLRAHFFLSSNGSTGRAYNCRSLASINPRPPKPLALRRPTPPPPDPAVSECVSAARCHGRNRRE